MQELIPDHAFTDGQVVWAARTHGGLFRRVRFGTRGYVSHSTATGFVVDWDNGKTTELLAKDLRADGWNGIGMNLVGIANMITPGGALEALAQSEPEDSPNNAYLRGFRTCHEMFLQAFRDDGLI